MTTEQKVTILAVIADRNEAGEHFTAVYDEDDLWNLEEEGLIEVSRPVHEQTGIEYSQEYWKVRVTDDGMDFVGAHPEYWPA